MPEACNIEKIQYIESVIAIIILIIKTCQQKRFPQKIITVI